MAGVLARPSIGGVGSVRAWVAWMAWWRACVGRVLVWVALVACLLGLHVIIIVITITEILP